MADRNTGAFQRFDNNGVLKIGSDPILGYVPGSFEIVERQRARIMNKDRGTIGSATVGDQRPQTIRFRVYRTSTFNALRALLLPAATSGVETYVTIVYDQPTHQGASTGDRWTWNKCFCPDGISHASNPGGSGDNDFDQITIEMQHDGDIVTPTTY